MADKKIENAKINVEFTEPTNREALLSGEDIKSLFGKIKKYFTDLKLVAFSGSYNDLGDKPTSLPANGGNANTVNKHTVEKDVPSDAIFTDTVYTHPTTSGNKHIPSGGSSGQILRYSASGVAKWDNENTYTLPTAGFTLGGVKTTSTVTSSNGYTACPIIDGVPYYKPSSVTTTDGANPNIYQDYKITFGSSSVSNCGYGMGDGTNVIGDYAMALGYYTETKVACSLATGIYNEDTSTGVNMSHFSWLIESQNSKNAFMIGNGHSSRSKSNAFRITYSGAVYGLSAFNSSGADYAEFISEWADGNINSEDRVGYFVTLKDDKLHKANDGDYILGVTSGNPSVVGNGDETYFWKYERDEFNRFIYVDSPFLDENGEEIIDENGNVVTVKTIKLSDDYDSTQTYIARKDRPEWDYVGMTGVIPVRDDGTCVANGYCKCGSDGIATLANKKGDFTYFVKERISDNVISVIIR